MKLTWSTAPAEGLQKHHNRQQADADGALDFKLTTFRAPALLCVRLIVYK